MKSKFIALVDGFCQDNGSFWAVAGGSYAVFKVPDDQLCPPLHTLTDPIISNLRFTLHNVHGERVTTNNVAEAQAMLMLFQELLNSNIINPTTFTTIFSDSILTINQTKGLYKINDVKLKRIHSNIAELFKNYKIKHNESIWNSMQLKHISGNLMKQTIIDH